MDRTPGLMERNNSATFTILNGSINGCDSTVTLDLTISNSVSGTDTQVACGSYTWIDGNTYTASNNTATFTILNGSINGCDSTVTLDLTISNSVSGTDTQVACGSYIWIDGNTYNASNNSATFTIPNGSVNGCDSIVTLDLTISNSVSGTDTQVACESYTWIDGNTYNASNNSATFTLVGGAVSGCDSIVTLDLTISNSVSGTDTQVACESYTWIDGNTYTASNNSATFTLVGGAVSGCDSIVTLDLTISNSVSGTDTQVACESYTWIDGNTYTASNNSATFTLVGGAVSGCDSIVALDLTINNSVFSSDVQSACDSYTWIDGNTYTSDNNSATYVLSTISGCDSIVTLDLTINALTTLDAGLDIFICSGEEIILNASGASTYTWSNGVSNGESFTSSEGVSTYIVNAEDNNGCTATDQVIVTAWPVPTISISGEDPLCLGENSGSAEILISSGTPPFTIEWNNGNTLTTIQNLYAGIFDVLVTDANTCEASSSIVLSDPFEPCYEEPEINIYIPNSFSPDNNEHNQTWFVVAEGISFENFTLLIFNRWGTLIWESHDIRVGWDGTYKNKNVPDGTYTYKLEYQEAAGEPLKFATGHLNVLR